MRDTKLYTILDDIGLKSANFTAATTDVITSASHGLKNGDMVVLTTTGTLPAGLALATVYYVVGVGNNTFKLSTTSGKEGASVDITDTGTGIHTFTMHDIGNTILVKDFRNCILTFNTDGGGDANLTVKFQGSVQEDAPDFSASQSKTNQWDYIGVVDLEDQSVIDGDIGVSAAAADVHRQFEANINALRWINAQITSHTAGEVTIKTQLSTNE